MTPGGKKIPFGRFTPWFWIHCVEESPSDFWTPSHFISFSHLYRTFLLRRSEKCVISVSEEACDATEEQMWRFSWASWMARDSYLGFLYPFVHITLHWFLHFMFGIRVRGISLQDAYIRTGMDREGEIAQDQAKRRGPCNQQHLLTPALLLGCHQAAAVSESNW